MPRGFRTLWKTSERLSVGLRSQFCGLPGHHLPALRSFEPDMEDVKVGGRTLAIRVALHINVASHERRVPVNSYGGLGKVDACCSSLPGGNRLHHVGFS